ncbi:MAG TPA: hypothetical protein EYO59_01430 [Chromatiaceae bacterium]|nr:hypothetical protein [Chromatiaceae bacterium]
MTLTETQWEKINKKYGMLMYKISHKISGDAAIANFEDNLQDIRLAAMEAVIGFEKQNDGANGEFDEFWGSKGFDQYIKTCMWTKKNNKGAKITKKSSILKGTVSTDVEEVLMLESPDPSPDIAILFDEVSFHLTGKQQQIVDAVINDHTLIKPSGKINIKRLSEQLDMSWFETNKHVKSLSLLLYNEL